MTVAPSYGFACPSPHLPGTPNAAGKTSLLLRFCEDRFSSVFISTVGVDFKSKIVPLEGERVKLQVWDTGTCRGCLFAGSAVEFPHPIPPTP